MKTITMYELLGMVKDGKAPKKIIYGGEEWEYDDFVNDYTYFSIDHYEFLLNNISCACLNYEVEILEEEKKIPEKIEEKEIEVSMSIGEQICANKINEIIDYLKNKGE